MPDLKQLLREAAAQGATEQQLDIIVNAYQENLKKKSPIYRFKNWWSRFCEWLRAFPAI